MRLALLSDLHGNPFALEAVVADAEARADELVCLGDVAIGPFPSETVARLRELGCRVLMGNWDCWLVEGVPVLDGQVGPRLTEQGEWCAGRLTEADREYLRGLPRALELELGEGIELACFHASPRSLHELLLPDVPRAELDVALEGVAAGVIVAGHTHLQMLRRRPESLFANPGSVGLPFSEGPFGGSLRVSRWAEYALVSDGDEGLTVEFRRVNYDVDAMLAVARTSGMPHADWWADCWDLPSSLDPHP